MAPRPIILDCDPGQDDALAILLALGSPADLDVLAVTTVAGNVPLALTERNARTIVELSGCRVPVHAGCARPLVRAPVTAEYVHGTTGLEGADLPEPAIPLAAGHAADAIIELVRAHPPGTVTLCPTGPLTNLALALLKAPEIAPRLREIVLMGGAMGLGNVTPAAEFNIYADPHAAHVVFEAGVPLVMCPLELTHQALVTPERLAALRAIESAVGRAVVGLLEFYNRYDQTAHQRAGAPLHDPCVIGWLLAPELFSGRRCHVAIETESELTLGRTVIDWSGRGTLNRGAPPANALILRELDADGFFGLLTERLARLTGG